MFSYFLMKGIESDSDQSQYNKSTAGELHQYFHSNVVQKSSGSQTPELQVDVDSARTLLIDSGIPNRVSGNVLV